MVFEPLSGLTDAIVLAGASPRARVDDVDEPREAGFTKQDSYRKYAWQIPSRNARLAFYTITAETSAAAVAEASDLAVACSCPFSGPGWCKHAVRCLHAVVDRAPAPRRGAEARAAPPAKRRRAAPPPRTLRCARCAASYAEGAAGGCARGHPRSMVGADGACRRCGRDAAAGPCFAGAHSAALAAVDAEGWPSDSEESDAGDRPGA